MPIVPGEQRVRVLSIVAGEHHVRVLRGARLVYAGWTHVGSGAISLVLRLPAVLACSSDDFDCLQLEAGTVVARETRCARFIVATRAQGGLDIADCFGDRCGPLVFHRFARDAPLLSAPPQPERETSSHVLRGAALVGAAALVTGAVI